MLKVQEIRELIKLIDDSSISDFTYEEDGTKVTMKKDSANGSVPVVQQTSTPVESQPVASEPKVESTPAPQKVEKEEEPKKEEQSTVDFDYEIVSPMVGTFYNSPSPEDDPYVQEGSSVGKDSIVCIVEAMKLFNEIEAEVQGEIVEILVQNGELVEYGQPLFRVKKK
ncbi:acetyl-CoA carboxylase, biotin carboxyl carrier protein [Halalkalibacillus sediminis]|uniref:Biotin carboxyl carrier protein of acetyl-CoA carboxylase n=1 Tax=Halalkalibacillus sediminis TaxID=2018042 RepID=A0A2I0QX88_9BACI|nr:acetyl-CoA carboxylase biotin carboxyl carrier protein [Halalkalibacillus sediminis]PKR78957.1 acetyl-CoA carboxylase, biotin carboxyl carrier protein [Halalkalibacillus sediminis]